MERIFVEILNMSISSCIVIAAVIIFRLIFRRAPKAFFCILWAFVGFKLICPLTFQGTVCLIPDTQQIVNEVFDQKTVSIKTAQSDKEDEEHKIQTPESREQSELPVQNSTEVIQNNTEVKKYEEQTDQYISDSSEITESVVSSNVTIQTPTVEERNIFLLLLPYIWISVAAFMFVGAMIRYILLVRRLHGIDADEKGIYYSDRVDTPFILGVFFPKIYLPYGTKEVDREYILAHEYTHLHRLDHIWKPIGFAILCLHWFNPMVWVAFHLLCKDIELACDESVVRSYSLKKRKEYSHALINCSESKKALSYVPLAFGESGVKERVINVLSYKKPALWVILICILTVVGISVFLMTNPVSSNDNTKPIQNSEKESSSEKDSDTYSFIENIPEEKAVMDKNGMRKITSREFAKILSSSEFNDDIMKEVVKDDFEWNYGGYNPKIADDKLWEKVYKSVQEIQPSPDFIFTAEYMNSIPLENQVPMYHYWPDSNEKSERRIGLSINNKEMVLIRTEYDEYGDVDSTQVIYSYPYELEKAAIEKYSCSEERASRRLSNPYVKIICTSPVLPDNGKKLKGEEVLVPDNIISPSTKQRYGYYGRMQDKYDKMVSEKDIIGGTLRYNEAIAYAQAYPNMQKITADEILEIFDKAPIYEGFDYYKVENSYAWVENNIKEIKKIQYFADVEESVYASDSHWLYWPDADNFEDRRQEVEIFGDGIVCIAAFDENGDRVSFDVVFDLQTKIQKMKNEGIPFDEYPLKRKVTPEEVKAIFENAETDPNADYTDREVCIEWTMERIKEIEKIQSFPDWKTENKNDTLFYCYWPDSNSIGGRKKEIQINCETGTAILYNYESDYARSETLFDLREIKHENQNS